MTPDPPTPAAARPPGPATPGTAPPEARVGLVLAAGAGRRMGVAKALLRDADGTPRSLLAARALLAAGCSGVLVVLGARGAEAQRLLEDHRRPGEEVTAVVAPAWEEGMGLSLRAGLEALADQAPLAAAALVTLVDLPDVGEPVHRRVLERWRSGGSSADALLRATYDATPGHPVLLGRRHWAALAAELAGDTGAQRWLVRHRVRSVSCEDLATGRDVDRPEDLGPAGPARPEHR